jgi:hypothetical protein
MKTKDGEGPKRLVEFHASDRRERSNNVPVSGRLPVGLSVKVVPE